MERAPLHELVYVSAALKPFDVGELSELLKRARTKNTSLGVSGILLYQDGSFIQVIEGEQSGIQEVFARVQADKRHWRIQVLREGLILQRRFAQWSMGFVTLDSRLVRDLSGRHALLSNGSLRNDADQVASLLDEFRQGQWHRYVQG